MYDSPRPAGGRRRRKRRGADAGYSTGPMAVCRGKEAVKQKGEWWQANHEVHGGSVQGPYVNGDQFALRFTFDITPKSTGQRVTMDEVGLYTVKNGKISEERFYY